MTASESLARAYRTTAQFTPGDRELLLRLAAVLGAVGPPLLAVLLLVLLRRLVHRIQDAEIVLRVLEVALRHDPVAAAGRVPAELEILLEQLLGCAAHTEVGTVAVEHMIAVERDSAAAGASAMMAQSAAATSAATGSMAASTHAFHVHTSAVEPSLLRA